MHILLSLISIHSANLPLHPVPYTLHILRLGTGYNVDVGTYLVEAISPL